MLTAGLVMWWEPRNGMGQGLCVHGSRSRCAPSSVEPGRGKSSGGLNSTLVLPYALEIVFFPISLFLLSTFPLTPC